MISQMLQSSKMLQRQLIEKILLPTFEGRAAASAAPYFRPSVIILWRRSFFVTLFCSEQYEQSADDQHYAEGGAYRGRAEGMGKKDTAQRSDGSRPAEDGDPFDRKSSFAEM